MKLSILAVIILLPAFAAAAQSSDPVRSAIQAGPADVSQDLAALIGSMTPAQKTEARGRLDAMDRGALDAAQTRELAQAYRLLGGSATAQGASLAHAASRALAGKQYKDAISLAARALKAEPGNREALAVFHFAEGRTDASPETALSGKAAAIDAAPSHPGSGPALPGARMPRSFKRAPTAPPSLGGTPFLDPTAAGYWDKQLLAPLLKHSDANPVSREYLSPLLKANKVTIRLDHVRDDHTLRGSWGYFDLETSVIHYNLDLINADIRQYDAYYAKTDRSRLVRPIDPIIPLDAAQIEYVTGRFLPLALHEAGGHATHSSDLKQRLGSLRAPLNKDTEIMAWRLEAAAIEIERRHDPRYLTEPTGWALEENLWVKGWTDSRHTGDPDAVVRYLDTMPSYRDLIHIGNDPTLTRERYSESVTLVQSSCRRQYDEACSAAITRLATLFPPAARALFEKARNYLDAHPGHAAGRAEVMNRLSEMAIVQDRLDPKGITVVSDYYREQEKRVQNLEALADPLTKWQKLRAIWHE